MTIKRSVLALLVFVVLVVLFSSCLPRRRWYSTYKDKNGDTKTEHYNEYRRKWYRKNWYNREIWK